MWMTLLEQSEVSRVVFSMPPVPFIQICSSLYRKLNHRGISCFWIWTWMCCRIGGGGISCNWYQKPTDTVTILNWSCAPTQYKPSVIQGTVHRVFRSISNWEQFYKAMETNRAQWLKFQYPENRSAKVAADALCKIIEGKGKPLDSERCSSIQSPKDVKPPMLMVQYRGNQSE